jgi:hypothetical protein
LASGCAIGSSPREFKNIVEVFRTGTFGGTQGQNGPLTIHRGRSQLAIGIGRDRMTKRGKKWQVEI